MIQTDDRSDEPTTDLTRDTRRRAQYLAATTVLTDAEAEALAWREHGYSHGAIARKVDSTKSTVDDRLERAVATYGLEAVATKVAADRGETDLEPITRDDVAALHPKNREVWREAAAAHPDRAPEWFEPDDRDGDGDGGGPR